MSISIEVLMEVPALERAKATLRYTARLKPDWNGTITREEARALINELARLNKPDRPKVTRP